MRFRQSGKRRKRSAISLSSRRIRAKRSIISNHAIESNNPRSRMRISGSSGRGGTCVFSKMWAKVVQAVQMLKFECFLSRIGQTEALSTTTSTLKPHLFKKACTADKVVVFPAFGVPANSITTGLRPVFLKSWARVSARICKCDFTAYAKETLLPKSPRLVHVKPLKAGTSFAMRLNKPSMVT